MAGGDVGAGEEVAAAENATVPETKSGLNTSALYNLTPKGNSNVTVNDYKPQTDEGNGALDLTDYYPNANQSINVGNYSGSIIGSNSIYAPAAALAPLGMMDARDAAIHKAALQKQMEEQDFMKRHQYQPTKLDSANPELSNSYYKFLGNEIDSAKKKYGKNAYAYLNSDVNFQQKNQAFQNAKQNYDSSVEAIAKYNVEKDKPGFVPSKEAEQAERDIIEGHHFLNNNPADPKAQSIVRNAAQLHAYNDLDKVTNDALDKVVAGTVFNDPKYEGRGKNEIRSVIQNEVYSDANLQQLAKNIKEVHPYLPQSEEQIFQNLRAKKDTKATIHTNIYDKNHPPKEHKEDDYSNVQPQVGATFNATVNTGQFNGTEPITKVVPVYTEQAHNTQVNDQQKKISLVLNKDMKDLSGGGLETSSGNVEGNVQKVAVMPYDQANKQFLTPEKVDELKKSGHYFNNHNIKFEAGAIINTSPKKDANGNDIGGSATSLVVPVNDVKGKLSKGFDKVLVQNEDKAVELNAQRTASHPNTNAEVKKAEDAVTPTKLSGSINPATLKVGERYEVNGNHYTWNGKKLVK